MVSPFTPFLSLPPELQLQVLSELPARDIQKCRRVNKHFAALIDLEENKCLTFGPGIQRSIARLYKDKHTYCDYATDAKLADGTSAALLKALGQFYALQPRGTNSSNAIYRFAAHWLHKTALHTQDVGEARFFDLWAASIALTAIYLASNHRVSRQAQKVGQKAHKILVKLKKLGRHSSLGLNAPEDIDKITQEVCKRGKEWFPQPLKPLRVAKYVVEPVDVDSLADAEPLWDEKMGRLRVLTTKLGAPSLPRTAPITYCVDSEWALMQLQGVLSGELELDTASRAAILEEMRFA